MGDNLMKLTDLNPNWVGAGGPGISHADRTPVEKRSGVGMSFDCPCGCGERTYISFENPVDGKPKLGDNRPFWKRTGDDFESITISPSIYKPKEKGGCGWHGFIENGKIRSV